MLYKILALSATIILAPPCFSSINDDGHPPLFKADRPQELELKPMVAIQEDPFVAHKDLIEDFLQSAVVGFSTEEAKACLGLDTQEGFKSFVAEHGDLQTLMASGVFRSIFDRNYAIEREYILSCDPNVKISFEYNPEKHKKTTMKYFRPDTLRIYPKEVGLLDALSSLTIADTDIMALPISLSRLIYLEVLNLNNNAFTSVPTILFSLTKLRQLNISYNPISQLHAGITALQRLYCLNISKTNIQDFPDARKLTSLQRLSMAALDLTHVPGNVFTITSLRVLNLNSNKLPYLSGEISALTGLTELHLNHNLLEALPEGLSAVTYLETLDLRHNNLGILSPAVCTLSKLTALYLDYNQLPTLPEQISHLRKLKSLTLGNNALKTLPVELTTLPGNIVEFRYSAEFQNEYIPAFLITNPNIKLPPQFQLWILKYQDRDNLKKQNELALEEVKKIKAAREKADKEEERSKKK